MGLFSQKEITQTGRILSPPILGKMRTLKVVAKQPFDMENSMDVNYRPSSTKVRHRGEMTPAETPPPGTKGDKESEVKMKKECWTS